MRTLYLGSGGQDGGILQTFNPNGKQTSYLGTAEDGVGIIGVHNAEGEQITYMGTGEQGGGFFRTNNSKGEMTSYLGEGKDSRGGHLQTFNMKGEMTSYLGTSMHEAGSLEINNEYGIKVGSLGASFEQETYRGDGVIMLYDRTGEFGWMTDGKSSNNHKD